MKSVDYIQNGGQCESVQNETNINTKMNNDLIQAILAAKANTGPDAYLWLHTSGDCILWPSESVSENDNGRNAVGRWQRLGKADVEGLIASGEVDEIA